MLSSSAEVCANVAAQVAVLSAVLVAINVAWQAPLASGADAARC